MRRAGDRHPPVARLMVTALLTALTAALPLVAGGPAQAAGEVGLPAVGSALPADGACAKPSTERATDAPWTRQALGLTRVWQFSRGAGVTVAVVDTGVGTAAPALSGRVTAVGEAGTDCVGHGTFAAGLIAAAPQDGTGVAGLAPEARILAVRGTDGRGATTPARLATAIRTAADQGAGVIYVGQALAAGKDELKAAVAYAARRDALVVAPVAPDTLPVDPGTGRTASAAPVYWPAAAPGAVSVLDFGPDGGRPEGAPQVAGADLAAPGDSVVGVGPAGTGHFIGSGSSFAAAQAAGAAALVRARYPGLSAAETAHRLTSVAYPALPARLDAYASLSAVLAGAGSRGAVPVAGPAESVASAPAGPRGRALLVAGVAVGVVVLVAAGAVVLPRGRARGWRAAGG
ncbi:S8 family serine peptidase [Streptomyces sp. NPDC060002]|uniref:S8 family serine peptidase n=1 Tax=Streptomyces sp. NPDC060002 TaxID=3347033 RepID=UPI0036A9F4E3